jgi:hypothetical protein
MVVSTGNVKIYTAFAARKRQWKEHVKFKM